MSYPSTQQAYSSNGGATPVIEPVIQQRDPTTSDITYPVSQLWLNQTTGITWQLNNFAIVGGYVTANWVSVLGTILNTLSDGHGGTATPVSGNIAIVGANNIITTAAGGTVTIDTVSFNDHSVLVGSGAAAITPIAVGNTGELLVGAAGSDPAFGTSADGDFTFTTATATTDRTLTISNTDNTAATSNAHVQVTTGGAAGGDPYISFNNGVVSNSIGIDNSDSDNFKITTGITPSAGLTALQITTTGAVSNLTGSLNSDATLIGGVSGIGIFNRDTTNVNSSARLYIRSEAGAGDSYTVYDNGVFGYYIGAQDSSGSFVLLNGGDPTIPLMNGFVLLVVDSSGNITLQKDNTNTLSINNKTQAGVGALVGYLNININGNPYVIPYYNPS